MTQVRAYWAPLGSLVLVIVSTSCHVQVAQVVTQAKWCTQTYPTISETSCVDCSQETNWPRSTVSGSTQGRQRSDRCCCLLGRSVTRFRVVRKKTCSGTSTPTACYAMRARSTYCPQVVRKGQSFSHITTTPWLDTSVTRGLWNSSGASTTGLAWRKIPTPMSPPATYASASR